MEHDWQPGTQLPDIHGFRVMKRCWNCGLEFGRVTKAGSPMQLSYRPRDGAPKTWKKTANTHCSGPKGR